MGKARVVKISYRKETPLLDPDYWICRVYTDDDNCYEGEGATKEEAQQNALDVMRAND